MPIFPKLALGKFNSRPEGSWERSLLPSQSCPPSHQLRQTKENESDHDNQLAEGLRD